MNIDKSKLNGDYPVDGENEPTVSNETDDTIIGRIHKGQLYQLKNDINKIVAAKIHNKIEDAKDEYIEKIMSGDE